LTDASDVSVTEPTVAANVTRGDINATSQQPSLDDVTASSLTSLSSLSSSDDVTQTTTEPPQPPPSPPPKLWGVEVGAFLLIYYAHIGKGKGFKR